MGVSFRNLTPLHNINNNMSNTLNKFVPTFDGSNFLEWKAQMQAYLMEKGLWRITNGMLTVPVAGTAGATAADVETWHTKDDQANGSMTLRLAHNLRTGVVGATAALTWTALNTQFAQTGVAVVYQDFKAAMRCKLGTSNPAKDITKLYTHLERLRANQVVIPDYVQGMMLLNVIPQEWDHVAAYYVQTTTTVANVAFTDIRTAILAEHDCLGGTKQNQHHITDKISAVKHKGKSPKFSSQRQTDYEPASDEAGPSSSKRRDRGNRHGHGRGKPSGAGSHHHSHLASWLDMEKASAAVQQQKAVSRPQIALQPSRAGPSTMTIASFKPAGINYMSKPNNRPASAYTGQPSRPGPATLLEARS